MSLLCQKKKEETYGFGFLHFHVAKDFFFVIFRVFERTVFNERAII